MTAPTMPASSSALTQVNASSPNVIAQPTVSAAPTPVQTAYAVPMGMERAARASPTMLRPQATRNSMVGTGWDSPSEAARADAQTASSSALASRTSHGIMPPP